MSEDNHEPVAPTPAAPTELDEIKARLKKIETLLGL